MNQQTGHLVILLKYGDDLPGGVVSGAAVVVSKKYDFLVSVFTAVDITEAKVCFFRFIFLVF